MQEKTTFRKSLLSELKNVIASTLQPTRKSIPISTKSWNICTSAREISFKDFQIICVDDKLELLIKEGNPPPEELLKAWGQIYIEYSEAIDNNLTGSLIDDLEHEMLRLKSQSIQTIVDVLSVNYVPEMIETLKGYGFKFKYDFSDKEAYMKDLSRVISRSKTWVLRLQQFDNKKKSTENIKMTYKLFSKALFALSKFAGYEINANEITAFDFASRYAEMVKQSNHGK